MKWNEDIDSCTLPPRKADKYASSYVQLWNMLDTSWLIFFQCILHENLIWRHYIALKCENGIFSLKTSRPPCTYVCWLQSLSVRNQLLILVWRLDRFWTDGFAMLMAGKVLECMVNLILSYHSFLLLWLCHKGITKLIEKWDKFLFQFLWFPIKLVFLWPGWECFKNITLNKYIQKIFGFSVTKWQPWSTFSGVFAHRLN